MAVRNSQRYQEVWSQLSQVTDPELDEPVTELDFIEQVDITHETDVVISFRLPTYWCAANFAFMMGSDMQERVGELPWVRSLRVEVLDHFYADSINKGLAEGASFEETCGGAAAGGLDVVRANFKRKAFLARQERLMSYLRANGIPVRDLVPMTINGLIESIPPGDAEGEHLCRRYLEMRRGGAPDALSGEPSSDLSEERAFITATGEFLSEDRISEYMRYLSSVTANTEFNAQMCRSVLAARKGTRGHSEGDRGWPDIRPARPEKNH